MSSVSDYSIKHMDEWQRKLLYTPYVLSTSRNTLFAYALFDHLFRILVEVSYSL